jgi:hypothetical protein
MSERERWVVYPLLFLALGAALRDKLFDRTMARSIVCQELTVVDEQPIGNRPGRVLAKIGRGEAAGIAGPSGYLFVNGQVEVVDELTNGQTVPIAKIGGDAQRRGGPSSGYLVVYGQLVANSLNAQQYFYRDSPFAPALRAIIPWPTELMRALGAQVPAPPRKSTPPESTSPQDSSTPGESVTDPPLADPPENR